jgi:hypothetical protein
VDLEIPSSASTHTALKTGVKVNDDVLGYDARVTAGNCSLTSSPAVKLVSLLDLAVQAGNHPVDSTRLKASNIHLKPTAKFLLLLARGADKFIQGTRQTYE